MHLGHGLAWLSISDSSQFGTKQWWKLVKSFMSKKGMKAAEFLPIHSEGHIYYFNHVKAKLFTDPFIQNSSLENQDDEPPEVQCCVVS